MATFDLAPFTRATVGFDRLFDDLLRQTMTVKTETYPPYNLEKVGDDSYRLTMAVAGFADNEIDVSVTQDEITIKGEHKEEETTEVQYLHRGLASRSFTRTFRMAEHVQVTGAKLKNGLLIVEFERVVPEAAKAKRIPLTVEA